MKLARKFWDDAMQETVRPHVDVKLNSTSSDGLGAVFGAWWDNKSVTNPTQVACPSAYANMLNGNGFRLGDSRCALNDSSTTYYEPFYENSAAISGVSSGTQTELVTVPWDISNGKTYHSLILWNVKDVEIDIEALDASNSVITSNTVTVALDDYAAEYQIDLDLPTLFPSWDNTYKSLKIYFTIPSNDRVFFAGYMTAEDYYFNWDISDIVSIEYDEGLELISGEVPHQTMRVTVYDEQGLFDPTNPNGYYNMLHLGMPLTMYVGIEDAYLSPIRLLSTGDVSYSKHQLTITYDTEWQSDSLTIYQVADYVGNVGDDLQDYQVWTSGGIGFSGSDYYTNAATKELTWQGEINQLKLSSIGAFAVYNESYNPIGALTACRAEELPTLPAEDYHVTARDMRDSHATLERKPLLGNLKVSKYRYFISSETKVLTMSHPTNGQFYTLPEWCAQCAKITMTALTGKDSNGNTIPMSDLTWSISHYIDLNRGVLVQNIIVQANDPTVTLVDGSFTATFNYWQEESSSVTAEVVNSGGEECAIDNPFVTTDAQVKAIMDSVKYIYGQRDVFTAQWAQDWRVELGDIIYLDTQFETDVKCVVTGLKFSYPGLWGEITMRRLG